MAVLLYICVICGIGYKENKWEQKIMSRLRLVIIIMMTGLIELVSPMQSRASEINGELILALDPGHGGEEDGANYYGEVEKDVNLKIARYVKERLEEYNNVKVVLTRDGDEQVSLKERVDRAVQAGADMFISLHCNASVSHKSHGASVYISTGEGRRKELREFADYFLGEFEAIGLDNAGTFARVTQMGGRRGDGSFDDYYGVLRHSYNNGIPSLLVEHCFMDSPMDWNYIRNDEGIHKLAVADVNAIVAYYGLKDKNGDVYEGKHARQYGATTEAIKHNYYVSPKLNAIKLKEFDGTSPGMATYEVEVEDGIGINSIYLVYKNSQGNSYTVSLMFKDELKTGTYELKGYIPEDIDPQYLSLQYVGVYNRVGFDAGYNNYGQSMIGFGKCDWLNSFNYNGEADINITGKGVLSGAYKKKLEEEIRLGIKSRQSIYPYRH